jgi:hypothetical protein
VFPSSNNDADADAPKLNHQEPKSTGMAIFRCQEPVTWLQELLTLSSLENERKFKKFYSSIHVTIYEKCGLSWKEQDHPQNSTASSSSSIRRSTQIKISSQAIPNLGAEEASGYLQYIVDHHYYYYEKNHTSSSRMMMMMMMPDLVYFLQPDVFHGHGNPKRNFLGHADLHTITELLFDVTQSHMITSFLALGRRRQRDIEWQLVDHDPQRPSLWWRLETSVQKNQDPYTYIGGHNLLVEIFNLLLLWDDDDDDETKNTDETHDKKEVSSPSTPPPPAAALAVLDNNNDDDTILDFLPDACMVVSKERILRRSKGLYSTLLDRIRSGNPGDARRHACALERTWHVVFGSPPMHPLEELYPRAAASVIIGG